MKIINIELNNNSRKLKFNDKVKLSAVILTVKKWYGREIKINAYPSNYGPTYGGNSILYFYFYNDLGEELSDNFSKQINNWFLKQNLMGKE